jgi:hypothetical protein
MDATGLLNIITKTLPIKINSIINNILDILFKINEGVRKLNEIDFCNPLGYILTKALPPGGELENKLNKYGLEATNFISKINEKIDFRVDDSNIKELQIDIEGIRQDLESILPPPELSDIIPGGAGLTKTINALSLALTFTDDTISKTDITNRISLLKTFTNKLAPFTSPINIANLVISNKAEELNEKLRDFIRPEKFSSDLRNIINTIKSIDKSIKQLQQIIIQINQIVRILNVLVKLYKLITKLLKRSPKPIVQGEPEGTIITKADKVRQYQQDINDIQDILSKISNFLDVSILLPIQRIRNEILILLTGLNELYKNINACPYINDELLNQSLEENIESLQNSLILLEELFPASKTSDLTTTALPKFYNGYEIDIIKEQITDPNIKLFRRRVTVANQQGIIQYEGTPTYAPNDQVLIKEGEFFIDRQGLTNSNNPNVSNIPDEEILNLAKQIGIEIDNNITLD